MISSVSNIAYNPRQPIPFNGHRKIDPALLDPAEFEFEYGTIADQTGFAEGGNFRDLFSQMVSGIVAAISNKDDAKIREDARKVRASLNYVA